MHKIPKTPYHCAAGWKGSEMAKTTEWIYHLSENENRELENALAHVKSKKIKITKIKKSDFPLPNFSKTLSKILKEIETGRGFLLIRGLPVEKLGDEDSTIIYWGIGTYFGEAVAQNMMGELLSDVWSISNNWDRNYNLRGYQTPVHLPYHCDKSDAVGLMCLQTAKSGGTSSIASSVAIHNEIWTKRPDLLKALYEPFYIDHRGEEFDGKEPYYISPVFNIYKGKFFSRFGQKYVESAQRFPQVPRLTNDQIEALDLFSSLALSKDFRLDMKFKRGDLQFLNNHYIVHSRTEYQDYPELERRRHLVRMLLFTPSYDDVPKHTQDLNTFIRNWGKNPRESVLSLNNK